MAETGGEKKYSPPRVITKSIHPVRERGLWRKAEGWELTFVDIDRVAVVVPIHTHDGPLGIPGKTIVHGANNRVDTLVFIINTNGSRSDG